MNSLPPYTLFLGCLSLLISTAILTLGALALPITPALWIVPGTFACTLIYHTLVLILPHYRNDRSTRILSLLSVSGAYILAVVWTGVLAVSLTFALLLSSGEIDPLPGHPRIDLVLVFATGLSSLQPIILATTGIICHKWRKQEQYREKWKWKIQINDSNWSFGHD